MAATVIVLGLGGILLFEAIRVGAYESCDMTTGARSHVHRAISAIKYHPH